jgi:threonine dehydratase
MSVDVQAIEKAAADSKDFILKTPLIRSFGIEERIQSKHPIFLKAENLQFTGSFKVRGALAKIMSVLSSARAKGLVAASAGNHAQGVAFHAKRLGLNAKIVMPLNTPLVKLRATRELGATVVLFGESYQEAYEEARRIETAESREYIHAFNDAAVIAGQGSLGKEIWEECPEAQTLICPIGGGGLIAGMSVYLKEKNPSLRILGVQASGCNTFLPSRQLGHPISLERVDTIAEGIAVKKMGDLCFELANKSVFDSIVVSDEEIAEGLLYALENERLFLEGCGGAAIAAAFRRPDLMVGPTVIVLTGGNLDVNLLSRIIQKGLAKSGRLFQFEAIIPDLPGSLEKLIHVIAEHKASIVQIDHERIFRTQAIKEVNTHVLVETDGPEHIDQIKAALQQALPWKFSFY